MGGGGIADGDGVGGGLSVGFDTPATLTGTVVSRNQGIGGAGGRQGKGGGYAVGWGVLFGYPDDSTITLDGGV